MNRILVFTGERSISFEEHEQRQLAPNELRLRTLYSGISAGTEMTLYRGSNPYLHKRWDPDRRLFLRSGPEGDESVGFPVRGPGYEEVGEVLEIGPEVRDIPTRALVFGSWGHQTHHIISSQTARDRLMPPGMDPILGIFSHIGAIALNGIHDGRLRLGETAAIFGQGALGQIVAQAARRSGVRVIAVDLHDYRLNIARSLGAHFTINAGRDKAAEAIKELTGGKGADVCFEVSGSTAGLNEAIRAAAYSGRVVAMGFFQGEAAGLYLGEEFHHNRVNIVGSQISGTDPELTYRWDRLRLAQTAIRLQADGILNLRPLITHIEPFDRAAVLFETLDRNPDDVLQAVIQFPAA